MYAYWITWLNGRNSKVFPVDFLCQHTLLTEGFTIKKIFMNITYIRKLSINFSRRIIVKFNNLLHFVAFFQSIVFFIDSMPYIGISNIKIIYCIASCKLVPRLVFVAFPLYTILIITILCAGIIVSSGNFLDFAKQLHQAAGRNRQDKGFY